MFLRKKFGQAVLEVCVMFTLVVMLMVLMLRIWNWTIVPIVQRQVNYNNTRVIAGAPIVGSSSNIREPVIWPVYITRPLDKDYLFKGQK